MFLDDLNETSFKKLNNALTEVFGLKLNFNTDAGKLQAIKEHTDVRIEQLRDNGVDVSSKEFQKLLLIKEGLAMALKEVAPPRQDKKVKRKIKESQDLDQAEVLLAAKQLADDLQKMAEDLANMQVQELMSITNAMKDEVGTAEAEAFNAAAESAIASALESVKAANESVANAVLAAQGQEVSDMGMDDGMGMEPEMGMDDDMGGDMDIDDTMADDEFGGADAADAMSDDLGREMKEGAYLTALRMIKEAQNNGKVNASLLQKAFKVMRNS